MARRRRSLTLTGAIFAVFLALLGWWASGGELPSDQGADTTIGAPGSTISQAPTAQCIMRGLLPDPVCTPGVTDPAVTQNNIHETICVSGYTETVRPSSSYTNRIKREQMAAYGFTDDIGNHEEDHLISLQLGGHPTDPRNLWPQPDDSPNPKDTVELRLKKAVCDGRIGLVEAQRRIATDWTTALEGLE